MLADSHAVVRCTPSYPFRESNLSVNVQVMPCMIEHCMPAMKGSPAGVGIPLALYRYNATYAVYVKNCFPFIIPSFAIHKKE